jgi:hypothetical protein
VTGENPAAVALSLRHVIEERDIHAILPHMRSRRTLSAFWSSSGMESDLGGHPKPANGGHLKTGQ